VDWIGLVTTEKSSVPRKRRIVWARNMVLDIDLYAKAEIEILHHLTERGYEVFFISGHSKQTYKFKNPKIHLFSIPVGRNLPLKLHFIFGVVQFLSFPFYVIKVKPNFIIIDWDSIFSLMPMLPYLKLLGIKIVVDIRSTPTPIVNLYKKIGLRQYLLNLAFNVSVCIAKKKLDGMTIITDLMKKEICDKFQIDPAWVGVWSSGVSAELFTREEHVRDGIELRERLGLTKRFIICYHGGFTQSRGLMDAISAMSIVRDRYPDTVLFLLGTGSIQIVGDMRRSIQDNGLQDRVILHDAVDHAEVPKYIAMCDVGIVPLLDLPQWRNQCPLKLLEYLAMEKVVILTDIPCHREIVGTDKCGIYMSSISPSGIAMSIAFAYDNKEKLEEWGAKGRVIVKDKYTWGKIAQNLDDYLRRIENK
jgi:glycosyltransferase involved in cell wall biosynthesis